MGQWIHYEADIFFLMDSIHLLRRNLSLEVDAAYFSEKVVEDIRFIDTRLKGLFASLQSSAYLLDRDRYVRFLYKAKVAFRELVEAVADGSLGSQIGLAPHAEMLRSLGSEQADEAERLIASAAIKPESEERIDEISHEEFKFLFNENDEK
jgi:hypothetical protein